MLASRNNTTTSRLRLSYEAEDVDRLQPASYEKFVGELRNSTQKLKMAEKENAAKKDAGKPVANNSSGAIRKSYLTGGAMSNKESINGKRTNAQQQRMPSANTRRLPVNSAHSRTSNNVENSRGRRNEGLTTNTQPLISRRTSAACQKPITLRRGGSGENFSGGAEVATRSCVSSPGGSSHDSNFMDSGSPSSSCGNCDCENRKRLLQLSSEYEKLQKEYSRILQGYQPPSSCDAISAESDSQPSEIVECYKKEVLRLKDELLVVRRQREEDLRCYDLKEVDLVQQIAQLIQMLEKKEDEVVSMNKKVTEITERDHERKENTEFLEEEVSTIRESLSEAEEQIRKIQQAYFASEDECTTLKNVTVRLTKLNGAVGNVARDTSTAILRTNKRLKHLVGHFQLLFPNHGVIDPPVDSEASEKVADVKFGDFEDELYDGDLNLKDFPIVSQLKELEDSVMKVSDVLRQVLQERLEFEGVTKKERLAMWSVLKELHATGYNGMQNGGSSQDKLTNGMPAENGSVNGDRGEELSNWVIGYFADMKNGQDGQDGGEMKKTHLSKNNCDAFILESDHLAKILGQQAEICKLKAELEERNVCLENVVSKYTRHKDILSANCKGAEDEVKQLDFMIDSVLEALRNIPAVVENSSELKCVWKTLTGENYPDRKQ